MTSNSQSSNQDASGILSGGISKIKDLFQTKNSSSDHNGHNNEPSPVSSNKKDAVETYHEWGVRLSGSANASHNALSPALQSCYTQNVNEQNNNQAIQQQNQQNISSQIESKKGQRDGKKIHLESKQRDKERLEEEMNG